MRRSGKLNGRVNCRGLSCAIRKAAKMRRWSGRAGSIRQHSQGNSIHRRGVSFRGGFWQDSRACGCCWRAAIRRRTIEWPEIAADGPQLHSSLPLKLEFSILRLSRSDPREAALVKMLRVAEPELADSEDALVIPVIGRGRA